MAKLRAVLKRRWWIVLICTLVGVGAGVGSAQVGQADVRKLFTAQQVIVANSTSSGTSLVSQDTLKVTRGKVPVEAAKTLGWKKDPDDLAAMVEATFEPKSSSITVASNDADPKKATKRVDAFVQAFLDAINGAIQAGPRRQLDQVKTDLATAQKNLSDFDAAHPELRGGSVPLDNVVASALLTTRQDLVSKFNELDADARRRELDLLRNRPYDTLGPEKPVPAQTGLIDVPASRQARAGLVGILGLFLGAGVVMIIERVARRIDTRDELAEVTDLPILAEIGFVPERRRAIKDGGRIMLSGPWAEPYRRVRSAVQFVQANSTTNSSGAAPVPSVFIVTSTSPAEGKSTTSALVAMALAEVGQPTVLVGGDFRKPQVDRLVGVRSSPSLRDLAVLDVARPSIDDVVQQTEIPDLYVAAAGEPTREVAGLIEAAKTVCVEASRRGATVVIDSSPLQAANDTLDLLPVVDYTILVVRCGRSSEADLLDVIETLRRMDSKVLGIVLIGTTSGRKQLYYYEYYGGPEAPAPDESAPAAPTASSTGAGASAAAASAAHPAPNGTNGSSGANGNGATGGNGASAPNGDRATTNATDSIPNIEVGGTEHASSPASDGNDG